jgi:hypothetical protein
MVLAAVSSGRASHLFSDVPTTAGYHDAVSWLATRAVTLGCASGLYCPDASVTRAQMALFMNRLGKALSPILIGVRAGDTAAIDIDATLHLCQTGAHTPTYPQRAKVSVWFSMHAAGLATAQIRPAYTINAGASWNALTLPGAIPRASASATDEWGFASDHDYLNLDAGTDYVFAVRVSRDAAGGTVDPDNWRCKIIVELTNRNPDGENPETSITTRSRGRPVRPTPRLPSRQR